MFNTLGSAANVPTNGGDFAGGGAEGSWELPTATQKAVELGEKLDSTGQAGEFEDAIVDTGEVDEDVADGLAVQTEQAQQQPEGVPADIANGGNNESSTIKLKVCISQEPAVGDGPNKIVFTVMPRIEESGSADYEAVAPIHHPGVIQKYRTSSARDWTISGRLISRTVAEATENLALVNMIRAWRLPFHGVGTGTNGNTAAKLGAPPPILTLQAYGENMIGPVKCVLKRYSTTWDNAVDYIPTNDGNPFPVILDIVLTLDEAWSPVEFSNFDLVKFKSGNLPAAYQG